MLLTRVAAFYILCLNSNGRIILSCIVVSVTWSSWGGAGGGGGAVV